MKRFAFGTVIVLLLTAQAWAAGPVGHFLLSQTTIQSIQDGSLDAPTALKAALAYPEARKAFAGGAVAPDICDKISHYGKTGDLARSMIADAESRYKAAADKAAEAQAAQEVAFAYGWLSHCATDLCVHPYINGVVGDTYRCCGKHQVYKHVAQECCFTASLAKASGSAIPECDVLVPYEFLSRHTGLSVEHLRRRMGELNEEASAESAVSRLIKVTDALQNDWQRVAAASLSATAEFISNPQSMGNWDLDSGRLGDNEFDSLRKLAAEANGGELPSVWGKDYLKYYDATKAMPQEQAVAYLKQALGQTAGK